MGPIETIEIRLSPNLGQALEQVIAEVVELASDKKEVSSVKLYNKVRLKSDYLIVIHYKGQMSGKQSRDLGKRLITELKEYGLVYHNFWHELKNL